MKLITQKDDKTCVSACITMVLNELGVNITLDTVIKEFHTDFLINKLSPVIYLRQKLPSLKIREKLGLQDITEFGSIYLVTVPSLNHQATFHEIVIDTRFVFDVYDPRKDGTHLYYTYEKIKDSKAIPLKGYVIDVEIMTNLKK